MLDNIASFISLCETKSFKICAENLKIQPSTLSKHISELESQLGKQLIIRTSKRFELTDFGIYMYNKCRHIPLFIENTINVYERKTPQERRHGTLNVALGAMVSYKLICPKLNKFLSQYPNIKINISFMPNITTWLSPQMDVVLAANYIKDNTLDNRFVRHEYLRLYCNSNYVTNYGIPETVEELAKHSVIGLVDKDYTPVEYIKLKHMNTHEEYIVDMKNNQININHTLYSRQVGLNADYIFGNYDSIVRDDLNNGLLVPVLPEWIAFEYDFYLVTKKQISDEVQLLVNFLYECLRN